MARRRQVWTIVAAVCVFVGISLSFLPRNWIELLFGNDPDGGSGLLESFLILIPIVVAVVGAAICFRPARGTISDQERRPTHADDAGGH